MDNLIGQKIGRLTIKKFIGKDKYRNFIYLCRCECGNEKIIRKNRLLKGETLSCGCLNKEIVSKIGKSNQTHNLSHNNIYYIWSAMIQRCNNPKDKAYKYYGGRGITICKRWLKFENFYKDMRNPPKGKSIDRIDNNDNYYKENCRWATHKEQSRNMRSNELYFYNNKEQCISAWAEEYKINRSTLEYRLHILNWSIEKSLNTPIKGNKK